MPDLRRSLSTHWKRSKSKQYICMSDPVEPITKPIPEFVIPGRTRFPSNALTPKPVVVEDFPIVRAADLVRLSEEPHDGEITRRPRRTSSLRRSVSENLLRLPHPLSVDGAMENPFLTPPASRPLSRAVSGGSTAGLSAFSRAPSSCPSQQLLERSPRTFVDSYNTLASLYDLTKIAIIEEHALPLTKSVRPRNWFLHKVSKSSTSLKRKNSAASLLGLSAKASLKGQTLDTMYRIGGFSALHLPSSGRNVELFIPTPLAATAQYLLKHGHVGGIFRKPGSSGSVKFIYDRYASLTSDLHENVETTIGSTTLPSWDIPYEAHDIASTFKKCLWDVPGGILGSVTLFKILKEIKYLPPSQLEAHGLRLIALALLSLRSSRRLDLVTAVFALLHNLVHDEERCQPRPSSPTSEQMTAGAFGVVFAPLLVGELIEDIDCASSPTKKTLFKNVLKSRQADAIERSQAMSLQKSRMLECSGIVEMLVGSWNSISRQMYLLETVLHKPLPQLKMSLKENMRPELQDIRDENVAPTEPALSSPQPCADPVEEEADDIFALPIVDAGAPLVRCASLNLSKTPPKVETIPLLPHSTTAVDLRTNRWPTMLASHRYHTQSSSAVELPWWERRKLEGSPVKSRKETLRKSSPARFDQAQEGPQDLQAREVQIAETSNAGKEEDEQDVQSNPTSEDTTSLGVSLGSRNTSHALSDMSSSTGSQKLRVSALYNKILQLELQLQAQSESTRALLREKDEEIKELQKKYGSARLRAFPSVERMRRNGEMLMREMAKPEFNGLIPNKLVEWPDYST